MTQPSNKAPEYPSPDGLTEADLDRFNDWSFKNVSYNQEPFALKIFEYATLYEREQSAAKDQRIKELKTALDEIARVSVHDEADNITVRIKINELAQKALHTMINQSKPTGHQPEGENITLEEVQMVGELFSLMHKLSGHSARYVQAKEIFKHFNIERKESGGQFAKGWNAAMRRQSEEWAKMGEDRAQLRAEVERWKWHYDGVNETRQAQAEEIKRLKYQLDRIWAISTTWEPTEGMDEIRKTIKP